VKDQECSLGRVFVLRLEEGDRVPETIETFAEEKNVERALCLLLSGFKGGTLVSWVDEGKMNPVAPFTELLHEIHEAAGIGTIFPGEDGTPKLHMRGRRTAPVWGVSERAPRCGTSAKWSSWSLWERA